MYTVKFYEGMGFIEYSRTVDTIAEALLLALQDSSARNSYDGYMWLGEEIDAQIIYYLENESTRLYPVDYYTMNQYEDIEQSEYVTAKEKQTATLAS